MGSLVQFIYGFGRVFGYQVDIKETSSIDELNQAIKSNSFDMVYYFIQEGNAQQKIQIFSLKKVN